MEAGGCSGAFSSSEADYLYPSGIGGDFTFLNLAVHRLWPELGALRCAQGQESGLRRTWRGDTVRA